MLSENPNEIPIDCSLIIRKSLVAEINHQKVRIPSR